MEARLASYKAPVCWPSIGLVPMEARLVSYGSWSISRLAGTCPAEADQLAPRRDVLGGDFERCG